MLSEVVCKLAAATCFSFLAITLALLLRTGLRRLGGPTLAYGIWLAVPVGIAVALLPPHRVDYTAGLLAGVTSPLKSAITPLIASVGPTLFPVLVCVWAAGTVLFFAVLLRRQLRFNRGLGATTTLNHVVYAEHAPGCPAIVGVIRPKIVVPEDFDLRYTAEERMVILAHERMHLRRGDLLANALCAFLRCVLWFNPLLHFATARFRFDQELACDAAVLRQHPTTQRTYATAMLKTHLADAGLPVGCYWASRHPLKQRILQLRKPSIPRGRRCFGRVLLVVTLSASTYAAWAAQPYEEMILSDGAARDQAVSSAGVPSPEASRSRSTSRRHHSDRHVGFRGSRRGDSTGSV
jgi:bla regulator protein BlaR1